MTAACFCLIDISWYYTELKSSVHFGVYLGLHNQKITIILITGQWYLVDIYQMAHSWKATIVLAIESLLNGRCGYQQSLPSKTVLRCSHATSDPLKHNNFGLPQRLKIVVFWINFTETCDNKRHRVMYEFLLLNKDIKTELGCKMWSTLQITCTSLLYCQINAGCLNSFQVQKKCRESDGESYTLTSSKQCLY